MAEKDRFGKREYIRWERGEKLRIAVMYQVASYWPTIESFYDACMADQDTEIRIFFVGDLSVEKAQVEGSDKYLEEKGIPYTNYSEERLQEFMPHAAVYQPPYDVSYRNPSALSLHLQNKGIRIVYIPYGIEIADTEDAHYNHFFTYVIRNCWRMYTFSEAMREDYLYYCPNRQAVRALGVPKFDSVFQKRIFPDPDILKQADGRRVVLWKLHFPKLIYEGMNRRQVTPYLSEYLKFAETIEKYKELLFVIMPHPMFFSQTIDSGLAGEAKKLFSLLETMENVRLEKAADYRSALYHSDAVIIDRSALMVEAGMCKVPVLYMKNSDYEEPLTKAVKPLADAYEQGTTAEDMGAFIERFRSGRLQTVSDRIAEKAKEMIPFADGKCGRRILEDIKNGAAEPLDPTIRVVFFGAGFICEHYIRELGILNDSGFRIAALSDNDSGKWGTIRAGIEVVPPESLKKTAFDILVITSEQYYMPIKKRLVYELFLDEEKIWRLDVFAERYLRRENKEMS